jgi:hypothetical protein
MSKARDLANAGTALGAVTATELGYVDGVTSAIQTQIDGKQAINANVSTTELGYLDGVTSAIQTQIDSKIGSASAINPTIVDAKGDIIAATAADTVARLAVGANDTVLTADSTAATGLKWSSAGITWTQRLNAPSGQREFDSMATNGTTIYVAVSQNGILYSSTDSAVTWASRTSGFGTTQILSVTFGNGIFVAVGASGTITTSTDGITWTARTSGVSTNTLNCVEYINSVFVAVGAGASGGTGGVTTSTDGITWTKRTTPASTSTTLYSVTYGNGYYVAVGNFSTTAGIYSTNLSTWTALPVSLPATMRFVTYQSSQFIAFDQNSTTAYATGSTPSSAWAGYSEASIATPSVNVDSLNGQIKLYNSRLYFFYKAGGNPLSWTLQSVGNSFTAGAYQGFEPYYTPIPIPAISKSAGALSYGNALVINSTGGIVIATTNGRIYTSF